MGEGANKTRKSGVVGQAVHRPAQLDWRVVAGRKSGGESTWEVVRGPCQGKSV